MSPLFSLFLFTSILTAVVFFFLQVACRIHETKKTLAKLDHMIMEIAAILSGLEKGRYYRVAFSNSSKVEYYQINI